MLKRSATGGLLLRVGLCEILKVYISNGFVCVVSQVVACTVYSFIIYRSISHSLTLSLRRLSVHSVERSPPRHPYPHVTHFRPPRSCRESGLGRANDI